MSSAQDLEALALACSSQSQPVEEVQTLTDLDSRRKHNASVPISQLPAENLLQIFEECSFTILLFSQKRSGSDTLRGDHRDSQIILSQVCHHWRAIVITTPTLWKDFYINECKPVEVVDALLRRSGVVPFCAEVDIVPAVNSAEVLTRVFEDLPRMAALDVNMRDLIVPWPEHPAVSCQILGLQNYDEVIHSLDANMASFARTLDRKLPALKRLGLLGHRFDFTNWALPSTLVFLSVRNDSSPHTSSFNDILLALRNLPRIETLMLHHVLPLHAIKAPSTALEPVALPLLQALVLHGYIEASLDLLRYLRLPSGLIPDLQLYASRYGDFIDHTPFTQLVPVNLHLRTLAVVFREQEVHQQHGFFLSAWTELLPLEDIPSRSVQSDVRFSLVVDSDASLHDGVLTLEDLLLNLPIARTHMLYVTCEYIAEQRFSPLSAFNRMKDLHTLWFVGPGAHTGLERSSCLTWLFDEDEDDYEEVCFPRLRRLYLESIVFGGMFQPFLKALRRRQGKARIRELVLRDCYDLSSGDVDTLREHIRVDWDSKVCIIDSGPEDWDQAV
ncbi:hypothetical protein NM688_g953 [Phlebia brevispora]|uniref:Uncharacterized protein n=1 Tax=Phlebia brevispora TaxID=194682 RepID=A0ACC1TD40_9APHY|nr:hypothetical protein NM688_g953 [Phlebia brevispora]